MFDRQLDVFGGEHDIPPANERMRLFEPVKVMTGQTTIPTETLVAPMPGNLELVNRSITSYLEMYASEGNWLAYKAMFVCCRENENVPARLKWERVASTRARYEHDRSIARTTFHTVPTYAIAQYVREETGLEHGPTLA